VSSAVESAPAARAEMQADANASRAKILLVDD
jgi:hypothetical protein